MGNDRRRYWLLKTEPSEYSWADQAANGGVSHWDSVKNRQAQKNMKSMSVGDRCFFYHSGSRDRRVVGVVEVIRTWYDNGDGGAVDVKALGEMRRAVGLGEIKEEKGDVMREFGLLRQPRLSVVPVDRKVWERVVAMGGGYGDDDDDGDGVDDDDVEDSTDQEEVSEEDLGEEFPFDP